MPDPRLILFAHGAGAPSRHPWMLAWRERLASIGNVQAFDYPYMLAGSKRPDRQSVLIAAHIAAIDDACNQAHHKGKVVLAGKSMGSRIGCHVAGALPDRVAALICFGFPLGTGDKAELRSQCLLQLKSPILFVQGTRDPLCPLDALEDVRRQMTAPSMLHVVQDGDHSLQVTKTALKQKGQTQADVDAEIFAAISLFLRTQNA
jgi:predicted alpha/beta-hydrolase family hydrolase